MSKNEILAVKADSVPVRKKKTLYPEPFASKVAGREKRQLGDYFGIKNFGVNLTTMAPGSQSALLHRHSKQDEFIFILEGTPTLLTESEEILLEPGMCAGFPSGKMAHHLVNKSKKDVVYLEVGDRTANDTSEYPNDDIVATFINEQWVFTRKDGTRYENK
ncbi:cupin domain-containing protein [bacterium]|nr:cupin domain-containing protein [bacterium]